MLACTWLHACFAERLHSCTACGRHTWTSARKSQFRVRVSPHCSCYGGVSAVRLVRRDVQPQHVVECRRALCACVPFDVRAVDHAPWPRDTTRAFMSWSLKLCIHVRSGHTNFHSDPLSSCTSRAVPAYCASSRSQTHKPHHHGLRRHEHVDSDVQPEKPKTVNNALLTLRGSCEYG